MGLKTFVADAVDAYCQAPEHEEMVVEPAPEYLERLATAGRDTDILWQLRRHLPERRAAGQSWVEHVAGIIVNESGFCAVHDSATVLLERSATRCIGIAHGRHPWCSDSEWTRTIRHVRLSSGCDGCELGNHMDISSDF